MQDVIINILRDNLWNFSYCDFTRFYVITFQYLLHIFSTFNVMPSPMHVGVIVYGECM